MKTVAVIGGGPAGLFAAEIVSAAGVSVTVHDRMATVGRKFLMAGRGGLNLTHSEPLEQFLERYGPARDFLAPSIEAFPPSALRDWAAGLGQETFVGSSGRVFPVTLKASPLLRAWLARLRDQGVVFRLRSDWRDLDEKSDATLLALGGGSWPRLGSDGGWTEILAARGVEIAPLRPANCGFQVGWSDIFKERFAGQPLKNIALSFAGRTLRGEAMVTSFGLEGGTLYALSSALRETIARDGEAVLHLDLCPDRSDADLARQLDKPRRGQSDSSFLRKTLSLSPVAINLLREASGPVLPDDLAGLIRAVPITLLATAPIERAISSAGGIALSELDEHFMIRRLPGMFAAGEMLDWEAPTGGYLLQASFATARAAALGILARLA